MEEYIVIDIGTSSLRVLVMDQTLQTVEQQVKKYNISETFDAELLWENICSMCLSLRVEPSKIRAIGVSALLGWVGVNRQGQAVTPCYTYMHQCPNQFIQAEPILKQINVYNITGRLPNPELAVYKLMQLQQHPALYQEIACLVSLKDFINQKLTHVLATDRTSACYTMLYDIRKKQWSQELISALGIDSNKLPPLCEPSDVLAPLNNSVASQLHLPQGITVVVGSVDGSTGVLGAGGIEPGTMVSVMGTTDTSFFVAHKDLLDSTKALVMNPHVVGDRWLLGGPMGMYGGTVEWLITHIMQGKTTLDELKCLAKDVPRGSNGVTFIPTLAGERAPYWIPQMRGTILGMKPTHGPGELFRAILESNAFSLKRMTELIEMAGGKVECMISIGGGAKDNLWLQIKAEVLGIPVLRTGIQEATACGTCMLAMLANGKHEKDLPRPCQLQAFEGSDAAVKEYHSFYTVYQQMHEEIHSIYKNLSV
ncbi:MAG: hypothetical protein E7476_11950 [Ruminococcaceae bacterium]|nr:hypothetical protein [Oscillospiraceae bacterium]